MEATTAKWRSNGGVAARLRFDGGEVEFGEAEFNFKFAFKLLAFLETQQEARRIHKLQINLFSLIIIIC